MNTPDQQTFVRSLRPSWRAHLFVAVAWLLVMAGRSLGQSMPQLAGLSFSPSSVTAAAGSTGSVSLYAAAPAGGTTVKLQSSGAWAVVPTNVIVAAGQTSATFAITTAAPPTRTQVSISATLGWTTRSSLLTVLPTGQNPQVPQGGGSTFRDNGTIAPAAGLTWDIVRSGGAVADSGKPNGWAVAFNATSHVFTLTSAVNARIANGYQVRYTTGGSNYSATFDVVLVSIGVSGSRHPSWAEDARAYDSAPVGGFGPSAADGVDLATGVYTNDPGPDLVCRNPFGPDASFERSYRSDLALEGYGSPGLSAGWTDNYDVSIEPVGSGSGWTNLVLRHTNGALEVFSPLFTANGLPTGKFSAPTGAPYFVTGAPTTTAGRWKSIKITSPDESSVTFTPDALDPNRYLLTQETNLVGRSIFVVRDPRLGNRITSITDDSLRPVPLLQFTYGASGSLSFVRDIYGRRVDYTFGQAAGANCLLTVSQTRTATSRVLVGWSYAYTSILGQPILNGVSVPNPSGAAGVIGHPINYDLKCRVTSLVDANLRRRTYTFGAGATQVAVLDEKGAVTIAWTQKISGRATDAGSVDAKGGATSVAYLDAANPDLPTHVTNENGQTVQAQYDSHGNILVTTDLRGVQTHYVYDYSVFPLGRLVSVQQGTKTPTKLGYYPNGLLAFVDTPRPGTVSANQWVRTSYTYTALGNVATVTVPAPAASGTVTYRYGYTFDPQYGYSKAEALGEPVTVSDPLGNTSHFQYDSRGNVTVSIDAEGNRRDYVYDEYDRLVKAPEPPTGQQGAGRVTTVYQYLSPDGPLQSVKLYDEAGVLIRSGSGTLGKEGELLKTQSAGIPKQLEALHDGAYRPYWVTRGGSASVVQKFDSVGNLTWLRSPQRTDRLFKRFDAAGNLLEATDGDGWPVKIQRAADDSRPLRVDFSEAGTLGYRKLNTAYTHDQYGRTLTAANGVCTLSYQYDDNDAVTSVTASYRTDIFPSTPIALPAKMISYTLNADGSRSSMSTPAGAFSYLYDAAGRMASASFPWTDGSVSYSYFRNGWLKSQQSPRVTTLYSYTARGNLLSLMNKGSNGTAYSTFSGMLYNGGGQRVYMDVSVPGVTIGGNTVYAADTGSVSYEYDVEGRLTREHIVRSSPYDDPNWESPDYSFGWNNDGSPWKVRNVLGVGPGNGVNPNGDMAASDVTLYDRLSRMIYHSVVFQDGNHIEWDGAYRPDGLRAYRWQTSSLSMWEQKRFYLYDGTRVLCEFDETGALVSAYGYGAGLVQAKTYGGSASTYSYAFDPQGSGIQRFEAGPEPNWYSRFDAFGARMTDVGTVSAYRVEPVGYSGQWGAYTDYTSEIGAPGLMHECVLMGYRFYYPKYATFLTQDPIGYEGGYNLYAYCGGDPVNNTDPSGLDFMEKVAGFFNAGGHFLINLAEHANPVTAIAADLGRPFSIIGQAHEKLGWFEFGDGRAGSDFFNDVMVVTAVHFPTLGMEGPAPARGLGAAEEVATRTTPGVRTTASSSVWGGRLGSETTRAHAAAIADAWEAKGWRVAKGAGRGSEAHFGPRKGGSYTDITLTKGSKTLHINTVDTVGKGRNLRPSAREARNAAKIRSQLPKGHRLLLISKP